MIKNTGIFIIIFFLILNFTFAANYIQNVNTVNTSGNTNKISWGGNTKYNDEWNNVINKWNYYGNVDISKDTFLTFKDLNVSDVYRDDVPWSGRWRYNSTSVDHIELNEWFMDGHSYAGSYNILNKVHNIGHELGHALGLDHHSIGGNFLESGKRTTTDLGVQDKKDYDYLMNNVY